MPSAVATEIYNQLGGNKFKAMTGAELFSSEHALVVKLPSRFAKSGINRVMIVLTPADEYLVQFYRVRGAKATKLAERTAFCDTLQAVFTEETGLATRL